MGGLNAANCDLKATTDGTFYCGTDAAGTGSTEHTDAGAYVYPNDGDYHSAPYYVATSTAATSSYAGNLLLTGIGYFSTSSFSQVNGVIYANRMPGADIGAQINNAYAFLPSTGGTIFVPDGTSTFSTSISFSTANKPVKLQCSPGAVLVYTGTATSMKFNYGVEGTTGKTYHEAGIDGCRLEGPDNAASNIAIEIGGTLGAADST